MISQNLNLINLLKAYSLAFMAELKMSIEPSEAVELAKKSVHCLKEITAEELHFHEKGYLEIRQATAMARSGMLSEARDLLDKALEKLPQSPSNAKVSGLMTKGIVEDMLGNFLISKAAWKEGLALAEVLGDGRRQAGLLRNLAIVAEKTGVIPEAIINNRKALSIYQQIGDDAGRGHTAANLSVIFLLLQQYDDAFPYIETALGVAKTKKLPDLEAYSLVAQARWQLSKNHLEDAHITLVRALQLSQEIELLDLYSEIYRLMAVIAGSQKDFVEANRLIALALENASDDSHDMGNCYRVRANIFSSQEYSDEANMAYETSQTIFKQKSPFYRARTELDWAKHLFKNREYKQSSSLLKHALKIFNETDATVLAAEVTQMFNLMTRQKAMGKGK